MRSGYYRIRTNRNNVEGLGLAKINKGTVDALLHGDRVTARHYKNADTFVCFLTFLNRCPRLYRRVSQIPGDAIEARRRRCNDLVDNRTIGRTES